MNLNQHRCTFITARPSHLRQKLGIETKPQEAESKLGLSQANPDDQILIPKTEANQLRKPGFFFSQVDPLTQKLHERSLLGRLLFGPARLV